MSRWGSKNSQSHLCSCSDLPSLPWQSLPAAFVIPLKADRQHQSLQQTFLSSVFPVMYCKSTLIYDFLCSVIIESVSLTIITLEQGIWGATYICVPKDWSRLFGSRINVGTFDMRVAFWQTAVNLIASTTVFLRYFYL